MSMTSHAAEPNSLTRSPPPCPSIVSRSLPCSARWMRTSAARPSTAIAPDHALTWIMSAPAVPLAVMVSGCPSPAPPPRTPSRSMFASVTSVPVRSLTTALSAPPSASRSTRSTSLVSMVMLPRLRKKRRRLPLAEKSKISAPAGAVEQEPVGAALPLDDVAAVARIPDERVMAGAEEADVGAAVAVDAVVLRPAEERLGACAAEQRVVAVLAVHRGRLRVREDAVRLVHPDAVVAAARVDDDPVERGAVEAEVGRAVVADVGLQGRGNARLQPEGELVACSVAGEGQRAVVHPRRVTGVGALGHDAEHDEKTRDDRQQPSQRRPPGFEAGIQVA